MLKPDQTDAGAEAHGAQHVEVGRLVIDQMQLLAGQTDVADDNMIPNDGREVFEGF